VAQGMSIAGNLKLVLESMTEISKSVTGEYELVLCLGNSIPHLVEKKDLVTAMKEMFARVSSDGVVIVQLLNYNRILNEKQRIIGLNREVDNDFIRFYDFLESGKILFNVLQIKWNGQKADHRMASELLYPWLKEDVMSAMMEAGFRSVDVYGEIDKRPFTDTSETYAIFAAK
jgi:glycine/sarcosine N-methyltransferase